MLPTLCVIGTATGGDLSILKLERSGQLTWTRVSTNAIYALDWSRSPTGPWSPTYFFNSNYTEASSVLTNQTAAWVLPTRGTNGFFYQLRLANATNIFRYRSFDRQGGLIVTGLLSLVFYPNTNRISGTWKLQRVDSGTNFIGLQIGEGPLDGLADSRGMNVWWPPYSGEMHLNGTLLGLYKSGRPVYTNFSGTWGTPSEIIHGPSGAFVADR